MEQAQKAVHTRWEDVPLEHMRQSITRRFIHSDRMMLAEVRFGKGDDVGAHRHENEQFTFVISGALHFRLGENQDEEVTVGAGEVLVIPPNLLHSAVALEDTYELDIFNPPREDWISGDDAYMRR